MSHTRIRVPRGVKVQREQSRLSRLFCIVVGLTDTFLGIVLIAHGQPEAGTLCILIGLLCLRHAARRYETIS